MVVIVIITILCLGRAYYVCIDFVYMKFVVGRPLQRNHIPMAWTGWWIGCARASIGKLSSIPRRTVGSFLHWLQDLLIPTARFAYPFILPRSHRLISYFFLPAVVLVRVTFFFPFLSFCICISTCTAPSVALFCQFHPSTLSVNPYHHYHKWCDAGVSSFRWGIRTLLPDYILSHSRDINLQKVWAWDWLH